MSDSSLVDFLASIGADPQPVTPPAPAPQPVSPEELAAITARNNAMAGAPTRTSARDLFLSNFSQRLIDTDGGGVDAATSAVDVRAKVGRAQQRNIYAWSKTLLETTDARSRAEALLALRASDPSIYENVVGMVSDIAGADGDVGMLRDLQAGHSIAKGVNAPGVDAQIPDMERAAIQTGRAEMVAEAERNRMSHVPAAIRPIAGGLRAGADSLVNGLGRLMPGMGDVADVKTRDAAAASEGQSRSYIDGGWDPTVSDIVSGAAASIPNIVAGGVAPGGAAVRFAANIVPASLSQGNESYVEGKDAGMGEVGATLYGALQGTIEGGIASLMQAAGRGGAEEIYKPLKDQIRRGIMGWAKSIGTNLSDEIIEEEATALAQLYARTMTLGGRIPTADEVNTVAGQTLGQTALLAGGMKAVSLPGEFAHNADLQRKEAEDAVRRQIIQALGRDAAAGAPADARVGARHAAPIGSDTPADRLRALATAGIDTPPSSSARAAAPPRPPIDQGAAETVDAPAAAETVTIDRTTGPTAAPPLGEPGGTTADLSTREQIDRYAGPGSRQLPPGPNGRPDPGEQIAADRMRRQAHASPQPEIPGPLGASRRAADIDRQVAEQVAADRAAASQIAQENRLANDRARLADAQAKADRTSAASQEAAGNRIRRDQALEAGVRQERDLQAAQRRRIADQALAKIQAPSAAMRAAAQDGDLDGLASLLDAEVASAVQAQRGAPAAPAGRPTVSQKDVLQALADLEASGQPMPSHQQMAARIAQRKQVAMNQAAERSTVARQAATDRLAAARRAQQSLKQGRATAPPINLPTPEVQGPFDTQEVLDRTPEPPETPMQPDSTQAVLDAARPEAGQTTTPAGQASPPVEPTAQAAPAPSTKEPANGQQEEGQGQAPPLLNDDVDAPVSAGNDRHGVSDQRLADAPGSEVVSRIAAGERSIDSTPDRGLLKSIREWISAMPTFQGGKQKMAKMTVSAMRRIFGADLAKMTEVHDLFGGGGSWGLYLAMTTMPNVRKLTVREFNPDRLLKIRFFHERGDQFMQVAKQTGAYEVARQAYAGVASAGGLSGRLEGTLAQVNNLPPDGRAVLQALVDYGDASFGKRSLDGIFAIVAGHAAGSKRAADAFRARGGTIVHEGGSSYTAPIPSGPQVMVIADPPYYNTIGYNASGGKVGIGIYRDTGSLMERLSQQGNSVVYTDEAWWNKTKSEGGSVVADVPPDLDQRPFDVLGRIYSALDHFDVTANTVAGRWETLGVINGFNRESRRGPDPAIPLARPRVGAAAGAVQPDARGEPRGDRQPARVVERGPAPEARPAPAAQPAPVAARPAPAQQAPAQAASAPTRLEATPEQQKAASRARAALARQPGAKQVEQLDHQTLRVTWDGGSTTTVHIDGRGIPTADQIAGDARLSSAWLASQINDGDFRRLAAAFEKAGEVPPNAMIAALKAWRTAVKKGDQQGMQDAANRIRNAWQALKPGMRSAVVGTAAPWAQVSPDGTVSVAVGRIPDDVTLADVVGEEVLQLAWRRLPDGMRQRVLVDAGRKDLAGKSGGVEAEEAGAAILADWIAQDTAALKPAQRGIIGRTLDRVMDALRAIGALVAGSRNGKQPALPSREQVVAAIRSGRVWKQKGQGGEAFATPRFTVKSEKLIAKLPPKGPVAQVEATLKNNGVNDREMEWTGLGKLLADKKAAGQPVARDEVAATIGDWYGKRTAEVVKDGKGENATKFSGYTLPGGDNYREVLVTLGSTGAPYVPAKDELDAEARDRFGTPYSYLSDFRQREVMFDLREKRSGNSEEYKSSHWSERNVLFHLRLKDRQAQDGAPMLFVEEVQSDWHQAGRDKGYRGDRVDTTGWTATPSSDPRDQFDGFNIYTVRDSAGREQSSQQAKSPDEAISKAAERTRGENDVHAVPNAPFRKTWEEVGFKRALMEAVATGKKWIGWTTGTQQADRYDLARQVSRIVLSGIPGNQTLLVYGVQGNVISRDVNPSDQRLVDVLGKDAAQRLVSQPAKAGGDMVFMLKNSDGVYARDNLEGDGARMVFKSERDAREAAEDFDEEDGWGVVYEPMPGSELRELTGDGLKIGGEGMKAAYDQRLVSIANKVGKKYGVQAQDMPLSLPGERLPYMKDPVDVLNHLADLETVPRSINEAAQTLHDEMHDQGNPETGTVQNQWVAVKTMMAQGWSDADGSMAKVLAYVEQARRRDPVTTDLKALQILAERQVGPMQQVAATAHGYMAASVETAEDMSDEAEDVANMSLSTFYQMGEDVGTLDDIGTPAERELLRELVAILRGSAGGGSQTVHAMQIPDAMAADVQAGVDLAFSTPRPSSTPVQALNDQQDRGFPESFAQWQAEADAIAASTARQEEVRARALRQEGLSPGEEVWLRRAVAEAYSAAGRAASAAEAERLTDDAMQLAFTRQAAGARAARELAARRLDLSTPQGRRELLLSYALEMPSGWQKRWKAATGADRAKITKAWSKRVKDMQRKLQQKYGIDILDPRLGDVFATPRQVGALMDEIATAHGGVHVGRLLGYYIAGNLLTAGSIAANVTGYPLMAGIGALRGISGAMTKSVTGRIGDQRMTSWGGIAAGVQGALRGIGRGLRNGAVSYWSGIPQAERAARPVLGTYEEQDRAKAPIKNPLLRTILAPAMEANRFLDEVAWTVAYEGALAAAATEKANADGGSPEQIAANPDGDTLERAAQWADWFTLRSTDNESLQKGLRRLGNIRAADATWWNDLADAATGGRGNWTINPLTFVMPFFNAIANLTVEGVKLSPFGLLAQATLAGRGGFKMAMGDGEQAAAVARHVAYTLGGLALAALAMGGDDDEPWMTGSPKMQTGSRGEREVRTEVEKPKSLLGINVGRFDPLAMPAAMWADTRRAAKQIRDGEDATSALTTLGEQAFSAVVSRNFLEGFASLFRREFDDSGNEKGLFRKYAENAAESMMPLRSAVRSVKQLTDPVKDQPGRTIAEDAYGSGRDARTLFGEPARVRADGDAAAAIGNLFAYPSAQHSPEARRWMRVIYDTNAAIERSGGKAHWPDFVSRTYEKGGERMRWSDAEYDRLSADTGRRWLAMLADSEQGLMELEPERRMDRINKLRAAAARQARGNMMTP